MPQGLLAEHANSESDRENPWRRLALCPSMVQAPTPATPAKPPRACPRDTCEAGCQWSTVNLPPFKWERLLGKAARTRDPCTPRVQCRAQAGSPNTLGPGSAVKARAKRGTARTSNFAGQCQPKDPARRAGFEETRQVYKKAVQRAEDAANEQKGRLKICNPSDPQKAFWNLTKAGGTQCAGWTTGSGSRPFAICGWRWRNEGGNNCG